MRWGDLNVGDSVFGKATGNVYAVLCKEPDKAGTRWLWMLCLDSATTFWKRADDTLLEHYHDVFKAAEGA